MLMRGFCYLQTKPGELFLVFMQHLAKECRYESVIDLFSVYNSQLETKYAFFPRQFPSYNKMSLSAKFYTICYTTL